jgi:hypothetical protein
MIISIAAVRAWLNALRQWLVDAAGTFCRRARPGVHDAWESFKERFFAAVWQAKDELIDVAATAAKESIARTPQGQFPAAL